MSPESDAYVIDTHALLWSVRETNRLPPRVRDIFRAAEAGAATLILPAIAAAELQRYYWKNNPSRADADLSYVLNRIRGLQVAPLGLEQILLMSQFPDIRGIHRQLIAAEARRRNLPLITRDQKLRDTPGLQTIWE